MGDHSYNYSRYAQWRKRISKTDKLKTYKEDSLRTAIDLCYVDETLEQIVNAVSEPQIYRAMRNARENCA